MNVEINAIPNPLIAHDGSRIDTASRWRANRASLLNLFASHVYGRPIDAPTDFVIEDDNRREVPAVGGLRRLVTLSFPPGTQIRLLQYTPIGAVRPTPAFVSMNFIGNQSIAEEDDVPIERGRIVDYPSGVTVNHRATEQSRSSCVDYLPIRTLLQRGYSAITFCCADIEEDFPDGHITGLRGRTNQPIETTGAIGAWAWGLSRVLDYISRCEPAINVKRVGVMGHSRMGKAALWAAACDERFAIAISNQSGQGGAAIHRRRVGETIGQITRAFPHWFCASHQAFEGRENELPIDQHQLLALIAPRLVMVTSAIDDQWADPDGERLACELARPVFELLGLPNLNYHCRPGTHDVWPEDWDRFLEFADRHLMDASKPD